MFLYNQEIEVQSWFYKGMKWRIIRNEVKRIWDEISWFYLQTRYHIYIPDLLETISILEIDLLTDGQKATAKAEKQSQKQKSTHQEDQNSSKKVTKTWPVVRLGRNKKGP